MKRTYCVAALLLWAAACSGPGPAQPVSPLGPGSPEPAPATTAAWTVSGTVWVEDEGGVAVPARGGAVFGWIEHATGGNTTGRVPIDADGRYAFTIPNPTKRVHVFGGPGYQPCAVSIQPTGSVTADVHTVVDPRRIGASLPSQLAERSPTLAGVVYEETPDGRRPVPGVWIVLDGFFGMGVVMAETLTDVEGRYLLCDVPSFSGLVVQAAAPEYDLFEFSGNLEGRTTLDIALRRKGR